MLISAILIFLGVPLWMVAGGLILVFWNRHRVKGQPGVFPVRIRLEMASETEKEPKWQRKGYAQWVHDVLILRTGVGLMQSTPIDIHVKQTSTLPYGSSTDAETSLTYRRCV